MAILLEFIHGTSASVCVRVATAKIVKDSLAINLTRTSLHAAQFLARQYLTLRGRARI